MESAQAKPALSAAAQKFVLHWGEMAGRWGVQRAVAQLYALLFVSPRPLNAEEIAATLQLARSTVSAGIHDLESAGLIRNSTVLGDRRAQYECNGSPQEALTKVLMRRKVSEVDAGIAVLRECILVSRHGTQEDKKLEERLQGLLNPLQLLSSEVESLIAAVEQGKLRSNRRKR